jgi:hypothetical protein
MSTHQGRHNSHDHAMCNWEPHSPRCPGSYVGKHTEIFQADRRRAIRREAMANRFTAVQDTLALDAVLIEANTVVEKADRDIAAVIAPVYRPRFRLIRDENR